MSEKTLADVLDRLAAITQELMGDDAPVKDGTCLICTVDIDRHPHDPDCGWEIAQQVSQSDVNEVRRLARVLRYNGRGST